MGDFLKVMYNTKKNTRADVYCITSVSERILINLKLFMEIDLLKWNLFKFHGEGVKGNIKFASC